MATQRIEHGPAGRRVAANLAALRHASRMSQPQLAKRMTAIGRPMTGAVLSKTEQLDRRVDVDDLMALALVLEVTPNRLLLTSATDTDRVELTPLLSLYAVDALRWANGRRPLGWPPSPDRDMNAEPFLRDHDPDHEARRRGTNGSLAPTLLKSLMAAISRGVTADALHRLVDAAAAAAGEGDR